MQTARWESIPRDPFTYTYNSRLQPVEATLSFEGIGGIRHASFEGGLVFIETVDRWEPSHVLAFSVRADSEHIRGETPK